MPAANCRTSPARSISLWLSASASAGSSFRVGTRDLLRRIRLVSVRRLVLALHARLVAQPLDRLAADDVGLEDLLEVRRLHARVPDVVGIDHEHRAVAALREAAGPASLMRTSSLSPALSASPRRCFTNCSTSPWLGHVSPLVQTNTCVRYWPMGYSATAG